MIGACVALAGCGNAVTSTKPLFSDRDAHGQAPLRPGVWGYSPSTKLPTCKVDTAQPVGTWDSCAGGFVVRPGEILSRTGADGPLKLEYRYVLTRGTPAVLQALEIGDEKQAGRYYYVGVRPVKFDERGRTVEVKGWEAMCGPPPPDDPTGSGGKLTAQAIGGLTPDEDHRNCVAARQGPVRASVRQSAGWAAKSGGGVNQMYVQWVRDGER
ncbi:MAG TPA: hypothetical protein VN814_06820 [Caulobacteraceae bacterium]|nr:hypothetical protein [Caulobacteraceae bacterium]